MNLFRFANPDFLYLLLLLPVMVILWIYNNVKRKKTLEKFGDHELVKALMPEYSTARPNIKMVFALLALFFLIIVLARPQFGVKLQETKKEGVEVIIALDVSNSMLAEDIFPSRLERAKQALSKLVESLDNDKVGLIVFAGEAYTKIPITTDYISAKMLLSTISTNIVSVQGTAIGSAIRLGTKSFSPGENKSKAMIIITDGENHEDDAVSAASVAAQNGIVIHTIGIGSSDGVPIQIMRNGRKEYLKDNNGNTVITKLDEDTLKKIAVATGGSYVRATNSSLGLEEIYNEIRKMNQEEMDSVMYTEYNEQYQIFGAISLFLLVIEFLIMNRKNRKLSNIKLFKIKL